MALLDEEDHRKMFGVKGLREAMTMAERVHPDGSRALAPYIWQNPERLGGEPAIAGRRIPVSSAYDCWGGIREYGYGDFAVEYDVTERAYVAAVAFHAGVLWERERRVTRKERKRG